MYARHKIFLHKTEPNVANSGLGIQVGSRKKDRKKTTTVPHCLSERHLESLNRERERERERGRERERVCVCVCVFRYTEESEATSAVTIT